MDMQNVAKLEIPEGEVRTIHDKSGDLLWGRVNYSVEYKGDTAQNGTPTPSAPVLVNTTTGENVVKICGKNLFDKDNANTINGYIDSSHDHITSDANNRILWIKCEPNTQYAISALATSWNRAIAWSSTMPAIGVQTFNRINLSANSTSTTFTTGASANYLVFRFWASALSTETYQQALDSIQIELGSTATAYEPYQEQSYTISLGSIELCKIGDYQDYIYKSGDKWYKHNAIGKVVYNGTENWGGDWQNSNTPGYWQTYLKKSDFTDNYIVSTSTNTKCTHFIIGSIGGSVWNQNATVYALNADATYTVQLKMENTFISSVNAWKTWLQSNNIAIYYALATPTDTEITNQALIAQLDDVEQWLTRYGYNTTVSGNLPIIIDRTAL